MRIPNFRANPFIVLCVVFVFTNTSLAHGIIGDRFFPPTIATDDPFAADELSLPIFSAIGSSSNPQTVTLDAGFEFDKLIFPRFAVGVFDDYLFIKPRGMHSESGWNNIGMNVKYELFKDEAHEAIISIGAEADIGGTGRSSVGADSFTTFAPKLYFGKGFGDLPDSLTYLKPLAVAGTLDNTFPTSGEAPNAFEWGFAVEYSLPYLQQHLIDVGLTEPLKNMIPLVEFAMSTNENRAGRGQTTGTINPGVLYETDYFQLGAEAVIPVNGHTGPHVGVALNLQIYIDDIFPNVFGFPIFGGQ